MKTTIFFDLDDTLLWDKKSVSAAFQKTCEYARVHYPSLDPKDLEEAVRKEAVQLYSSYEIFPFTQMIGINPFEGLWGNFLDDDDNFRKMSKIVPNYRNDAWTNGLKAIGIDDPTLGMELAQRFPMERRRNPFVYEETFEVLDKLKGKYKLLLLTNGSPDLQNTKLEITPELVPYFDKIIISGAFGRGKPDPSLFEHALEQIGSTKEETIMVGDNLKTDILGASTIGMDSVWINREHKEKEIDVTPTYTIANLHELFEILA